MPPEAMGHLRAIASGIFNQYRLAAAFDVADVGDRAGKTRCDSVGSSLVVGTEPRASTRSTREAAAPSGRAERPELLTGIHVGVLLDAVLLLVEAAIEAGMLDQFPVGAAFDDLAVVHHQDLVGASDRG